MTIEDGLSVKQQIIDFLRKHQGTFVSGHDICGEIGVSRSVLWKQMGELRKAGHPIAARPRLGYAWMTRGSPLARTRLLGCRVLQFMKVSSTNDVARDLVQREGTVEGTIVVADEQTSGRGRRGRRWVSPRGGLWFSVVLKPPADTGEQVSVIGLMAAIAAAEGIEKVTGLHPVIKWPNDIMIEDHKIGGILSERIEFEDSSGGQGETAVVVGVGVNVNFSEEKFPAELMFQATTLQTILGRDVPVNRLLSAIIELWEEYYDQFIADGSGKMIDAWRQRNCTLGCRVTIAAPTRVVSGTATDIDDQGRLLVTSDDGQTFSVQVGDVIRQQLRR